MTPFRTVFEELRVYRPVPLPEAADGRSFRLGANESPLPPLPSVAAAIADAAAHVHRYPDNGADLVRQALARALAVPEAHVMVSAGSIGGLRALLAAVSEPGVEVVYGWRSFEAFPVQIKLFGATGVPVPLRDERYDLDALARAITPRTRMVLLCNPNNPTGTTVGAAEVERFLDRVPAQCLVVLDEAYHDYVEPGQTVDGVRVYRDRPNVAVLRTFSKAHALAGLRIGYLVAHEPVTEAARKAQSPFAVNRVAQAAALAALDAGDELAARVRAVRSEGDRVRQVLIGLGYPVPPSAANFVWVPLGAASVGLATACAAEGVAVQHFPGEGVRATIGLREANDRLLAAAESALDAARGATAAPALTA
jgi:histidinol-phosphate aminotransferase